MGMTNEEAREILDHIYIKAEENKRTFDCKCGKQITVYVNVYDNSNSGMGHCE